VCEVQSGLPDFGLPDVDSSRNLDIAPAAIGVMLVAFAEGLAAAKTYAARNHYEIDADRELIGLGAANLASGLSSGMVVNGSLSKTAVNASAGAHSQLSGLVVAALTVVTLLFFTGLFEKLPEAVLAGIVIAALIELVDIGALVNLYRFHVRGAGRARQGHRRRPRPRPPPGKRRSASELPERAGGCRRPHQTSPSRQSQVSSLSRSSGTSSVRT
jgi:SulP family sulfate permease